jgi:hypothetical protein|tara:strand:+ start:6196 stop:6444 length:249 start_codon:yes stop_codon:yes gene_type:complete
MHRDSSLILTITPSKVSHKSQRFVARKKASSSSSLSPALSPSRQNGSVVCISEKILDDTTKGEENDTLSESVQNKRKCFFSI